MLSVIIPTTGTTPFLCESMRSAIEHSPPNTELVLFINGMTIEELISQQQGTEIEQLLPEFNVSQSSETLPLFASLNQAVAASSGRVVFLLSDDDRIEPGFFWDPKRFLVTSRSLYAVKHWVIDENSQRIGMSKFPTEDLLRGENVFRAYVKDRFRHNLSLFVFPRDLFDEIGGFRSTGYPNGYFVDTVFHAMILARADFVYCDQNLVFSRRESSFQGSARFYVGREASGFLRKISGILWNDSYTGPRLAEQFKEYEEFRQASVLNRFRSEWKKSLRPVFGKSSWFRLLLAFKFLLFWDLPVGLKLRVTSTVGKDATRRLLRKVESIIPMNRGELRNRLSIAHEGDSVGVSTSKSSGQILFDGWESVRHSKSGTCFVIGNGPSLTPEQLDSIKGFQSIASNKIHLIFEKTSWRPDWFSIVDHQVWKNMANETINYHPFVVIHSGLDWRVSSAPVRIVKRLNESTFIESVRFSDNLSHGAYTAFTVTQFNLQLAAHLGFTRMVLLGVDHNYVGEPGDVVYPHSGQDNHFDPNYRSAGELVVKAEPERMAWGYYQCRLFAERNGLEILNATPGSKLDTFQTVDLADIASGRV